MAKLNQIIAIEKGVKARAYGELTDLNKAIQKPELFNGLVRTYEKKRDDEEDLPQERKRVQFVANEVLRSVERSIGELMNLTARKDWTNCVAKGDVVIDGKVLFKGAPVSFLLFLEKQLTDMRTFAGNMPVLDDAEDWEIDLNSGLFKTEPTKTQRTKKEQEAIVLYPHSAEHPAQTQLITRDIVAGFWNLTKQSGAMPKPQREALSRRIEKMLHAVKQAREAANMEEEVDTPKVGEIVFSYLLDE